MYKLSPSDFRYLWEDCKHCYYQKVKLGRLPYSGAFPAVFTRMNNLLQSSIIGMNLKDINTDLPSGIIEVEEGFLKSKPISSAPNSYISGRFDILSKLDDGTYTVIDFKISNPDSDQVKRFSSQLHAYKYALENPATGEKPLKISKLGIITVSPEAIEHRDGKFIFTTSPKWHSIDENMEGFLRFMKEVEDVLNGELPPVSPTCKLCLYRKQFEKSVGQTEEIPF